MPMPRLFKKLSRKHLRQGSQTPTGSVDVEFEPPPLMSASASVMSTPPNGSPYFLSVDAFFDKSSPPISQTANGQVPIFSPNGGSYPPPLLPPIGDGVPQDDFSKDLWEAWASATTNPKTGKADRILQQLENGVAGAMAKESQGAVVMAGIQTGLDAVSGMEAIEKGLNSFMQGMPVLMNALDEVAKLHPFVGVAVMAFKAVWALEQKRRENDGRILALHMEMKQMMGVLTQLRNVKDAEEVAPDGTTIKGRMQEIVKGTADDIKACANACDTYSKKRLVVKVLKGPIWEGKLVKFVGIFTKRRSELEFALSVHTALSVDSANRTISSVDQTTQEMNAKMDMMMKMFQKFVSPEQKEMERIIEQRGGQARLNDEAALQVQYEFEAKSGGSQENNAKSTKSLGLDDLKEDLHTDPDAAIEQNMAKFTRKFEVQKRQIIDELSRVVEHTGDRVISAVTAGPHDKIVDLDVHTSWRGSVKTRHFVLGLRDHFHERKAKDLQEENVTDEEHRDQTTMAVSKADEWALEWINVVRVQQISEAFDDDASGFVTVAEANAFTAMRPSNWSLPKWIAYWSIGHHQAMQDYVTKIVELQAKMFAILPRISPNNKTSVNEYISSVYARVKTLVASVNSCYVNAALQERFASYISGEEFVLPLLYLLLERHFEIIRVCQTRTVHKNELWDASNTLDFLFDAVETRVEILQSTFKQQKLDPKQQFKSFSNGLYEYWNDFEWYWDDKRVQERGNEEYAYDDSSEAQDVDLNKILNHPLDQQLLDLDAYAVSPNIQSDSIASLFGRWHGFSYSLESVWPCEAMFSMSLEPSSSQGEVRPPAGPRSFPARFPTEYYTGTWNTAMETLSGTAGLEEDPAEHSLTFVFKRTEYLRFAPAPVQLKTSKARALWTFAISAVRYDVRRDRWAWSFFKERRDSRRRFIELYVRSTAFGTPLTGLENEELKRLTKILTTSDTRFYYSLAEQEIRATTDHIGQVKGTFNTVDLCESPYCITKPDIIREDLQKAHQPHHDLMKVRRVLHMPEFGDTYRNAKAALQRARTFFSAGGEDNDSESEVDTEDEAGHAPLSAKRLSRIPGLAISIPEAAPSLGPASGHPMSAISVSRGDTVPTGPPCCGCSKPVTQPCWYCVQCAGKSFICWDCDAKGEVSFGEHDFHSHDLVRVSELIIEKEFSIEERFAEMEERLGRIDGGMAGMEQMLEQVLDMMKRD
ncbi:hypothetical protein C8R44DRAFT_980121 [Mycena epipterygia]|nr:hypothetical protein C8R44DRAFT_980121 [Mycena epipterygia]